MGSRVDARDVLDPNARTRRAFRGEIVGFFQPIGANAWDDYEYVSCAAEEVEVLPDLAIQLEPRGAQLRLRQRGRVVRIRWRPSAAEEERLSGAPPSALRRAFLAEYVEGFAEQAGRGAAAIIASKLSSDGSSDE